MLGFVVCGSRGKGFETDDSDYECIMIVSEGVRDAYATRTAQLPSGLDVGVQRFKCSRTTRPRVAIHSLGAQDPCRTNAHS